MPFPFLPATDKEKPAFSTCPRNIYVTTTENFKVVHWTPPTFTDNVRVIRVTSRKNPGDVFHLFSTIVSYTAYDQAKNTETCSFTVNVKSKFV